MNENDFYYPKYPNKKYIIGYGVQLYEKFKINNHEKNVILLNTTEYSRLKKVCASQYFFRPVKSSQDDSYYFVTIKDKNYIIEDGNTVVINQELENSVTKEFIRFG